jgi:fatty acid CoA ligase FadD36
LDLLPHLTSTTVTVAGRTLAGEQLAAAAAAVAREVAGLSAVAVHADASLETLTAVIGGLMAGVPVVPVPPDAGPLERDHILNDSRAELVLGGDGGRPVDVTASGDAPPIHRQDPGRIAMIMYTSGTTGLPKGVQITEAAIATDLDLLAAAWQWTADDVVVHGLPLFHVHGLILGALGPLRVGSNLIHTGRPTPAAYAEAAQANGSLYFGVPTVWSRVAADADAAGQLRRARLLVSGSAGLPVPVFEALQAQAGQGPIERYGMTETLITVSGRPDQRRRPGWVGHALPGTHTRLVDDDGRPLPHDGEAVGELEVLTPMVMAGYLNRPDETRAVTTDDGWLRTGDVATIDPDGWHRIVGRRSTDLIKTGGYRVGAGEVEAALLAHPGVKEAAVVGEANADLGQAIVAYVVADAATSEELIDFVARTLSTHKRPRRVELIDELPRNAMGKVQKKLLTDGP